jgi:tetratricopeptide (TPR) repeat protein
MSSKERNKIAILLFCLWVVLSITNSVAQNSHINALSLKAQQAESRGNSELADKLFLQAIGEAKRTDSKTYIELVSRLVRERASNNKLGTADTYIQQALNAVSRNIRASGYNADTSVWMDDIAETLYDQGGRTNDEHIKDYCATRYLEIELLVQDRLAPQLMSRFSQISTGFAHGGHYKEAAEVIEKFIVFQSRVMPTAWADRSFQYLVLGNNELGANNPTKAASAFLKSQQFSEKVSKNAPEAYFTLRKLSMAKELEGKLPDALSMCKQALKSHLKDCGKAHMFTAWDAFVLARMEEKAGKIDDAIRDYHLSLECYQKLANPTADAGNNSTTSSGQVVAYEALAKLENGRGDKILSHSFEGKAVHLRAQHPDWSRSNNPAPEQFFAIWGYLPYPLEPIPTHRVY